MILSTLSALLAAVSLTVTPLPGESHTTKSGAGSSLHNLNRLSNNISGSQTKTITRSLKWRVEVRVRKDRPEKLEMKAYYIGEDAAGKLIQLGSPLTKPITLDKNGRAQLEIETPKTRLTKSRTSSSSGRYSGGFRSTKSTTRGERARGCVVQIYEDGELTKSWASDSRWMKEAEKPNFSIAELEKNKSRIGI